MTLHLATDLDRLQSYRETKTLFPRTGFFGVLTLQGEKMLAEAVPGIASDSEEMQAVRAIGAVQCIALCAQLGSICTPFDASALYRCLLVATTPSPEDSSVASVPIDPRGSGSGSLPLEIAPEPRLPVQGCHFWNNGEVTVRIQRRNKMFDHSQASYVNPSAASRLSRTHWADKPRLPDSAQGEAGLEWGFIADTLGWTGQSTAKRYPLAEFSLDIPSDGAYCSPSEYHDAVERVRGIILQAWKRRLQPVDVPADSYGVVVGSAEPQAATSYY